MSSAKGEGRNVITYYRPDLMPSSPERLVIPERLARAIRREELFLQYQPVVDSSTLQYSSGWSARSLASTRLD